VVSMWMPATVVVRALPARSWTVAVAPRLLPSPETTLSAGHEPAMPDSTSLHVQWTTTLLSYQPSVFGPVVGAPERSGRVLSTSMPLTVAVALFPAASVAVPEAVWPCPSLSVCGTGHTLMPD